jgi:hypothetical protein
VEERALKPGLKARESTKGLKVGGARLLWGRVGRVVWVLLGGCFESWMGKAIVGVVWVGKFGSCWVCFG